MVGAVKYRVSAAAVYFHRMSAADSAGRVGEQDAIPRSGREHRHIVVIHTAPAVPMYPVAFLHHNTAHALYLGDRSRRVADQHIADVQHMASEVRHGSRSR